jgi:hypothetical protein
VNEWNEGEDLRFGARDEKRWKSEAKMAGR